ncbi:MAG: glycosyltransferase, partial [Prolixibacteraceae bacterium]|nr:glycosyltransferase [Prolixibacteraceae bacterium]
MKILFCCPTFDIGGFSSFTLNMIKELKNRGYKTVVFIQYPIGALYEEYKKTGSQVEVIPRNFRTKKQYISYVVNRIIRINPDIIINNAVPVIQATFSYISQQIIKISVLHNILQNEINICLTNLNYEDRIVCVSENCRNALTNSCDRSFEKSCIIPVGIPVPDRTDVSESNENFIKLIFVGRLENRQKNLVGIVNILKALKKGNMAFRMTFIGEGSFRAELEERLAENGLSEQCDIT